MKIGKQISKVFFSEASTNKWNYKLCGRDYKVTGTGFTNLKAHIQSTHSDAYADFEKSAAAGSNCSDLVFSKYALPKKTLQVHCWILWVVMTLQPFSLVERPFTRKSFKCEGISLNTFHKYITLLTSHVEHQIAEELPENFCVIFDGWTEDGTDYVALFASFTKGDVPGFKRALLAFSPLLDETCLSTDEHVEFIKYHLGFYCKTTDNVIALIGDNYSTNKRMAHILNRPLVGCASHRFNLAVCDILENYNEDIDQINTLMKKLSNVKNAAKLRTHTPLRPKLKNDTRWSTTFEMLHRFQQLKPFLASVADEEIDRLTLSTQKCRQLDTFIEQLEDLNSVTKQLQSDDVSIADVHQMFSDVIDAIPQTKNRFDKCANIVQDPLFDRAVSKILNNQAATLSIDQKNSVSGLKKTSNSMNIQEHENMSLAQRSLKIRRISQAEGDCSYIDLCFIVPTSHVCERLFSKAGYAFSSRRRGMSPARFESQIFLHVNHDYWCANDVHEILKK